MSTTKLTVAETVAKLKEKNPNPRKIFNKAELTQLVQAVLVDPDYAAKFLKVKGGQFITEDRKIADEFKKGLIDLVKQLGLSTKEAEAAVENYRVPKALASAIVDAVNHADHLYMKEVGKGVTLLGDGDAQQTLYYREVGEKTHHIPKKKDGTPSEYSSVRVKSHGRLAMKTRVNPSKKELLK